MQFTIHMPRASEGEVHQPTLRSDISITPRVYSRCGRVTGAYITASDATGKERAYQLQQNATNGRLFLVELKPAVAACDAPSADDKPEQEADE